MGLCGGNFLKPEAKNKFHRRKPTYIYHLKTLQTAANKTGIKLKEIGEKLKQKPKNKRGRPPKSK